MISSCGCRGDKLKNSAFVRVYPRLPSPCLSVFIRGFGYPRSSAASLAPVAYVLRAADEHGLFQPRKNTEEHRSNEARMGLRVGHDFKLRMPWRQTQELRVRPCLSTASFSVFVRVHPRLWLSAFISGFAGAGRIRFQSRRRTRIIPAAEKHG